MRLSVLSLMVLAAGCDRATGEGGYAGDTAVGFDLFGSAAGDDGATDQDQDGLTKAEELQIGSDPAVADTDQDGWNDGDEVKDYGDPLDPDDHPYTGGWPRGACRNDVKGTGNQIGDVAEDFALLDQNGDTVHLHDFCDRTVLLLSSAVWCGPCNAEAPEVGAWYADLDKQGLMVITLLAEDAQSGPPSQEALAAWATTHGLKHPVVADVSWEVTSRFVDGGSIGVPTMHLMKEGLVVEVRDGWVSRPDIESMLP